MPIVERAAVERIGGQLWGFGQDYKASFDSDVSFFPALGSRADRHYPVRVATLSYGRDKQVLAEADIPHADGLDVRYQRADGVSEHYAVRGGGVELSYRFESKPTGTGDLVVRVQLETDLELSGTLDEDGSFELGQPEIGGVRIGAVTGVDARGRKVPGATRYENGVLELSLPAEFVDEATYPIVLDPLIETNIIVAAAYDEHAPDVAYDRTTDTFLIVWSRRYTTNDYAIMGSRYDSAGNFKGFSILALESGEPAVANVAIRDRFVVSWRRSNAIRCCTVSALTGEVSSKATIEDVASHWPGEPDVGGESSHEDDDAIVVWRRSSNDDQGTDIRAAQVQVALDGTPIVFGVKTLDTATAVEHFLDPVISKSGGASGRHMVVWSGSDVRGAVIDRDTNKLDEIVFESGNKPPEVDGNGVDWLVAYSDGQRVLGQRMHFVDGINSVFSDGPILIHEHPVNTSWQPHVATYGGEYLVAFLYHVPLLAPALWIPHQVMSKTVNPITGTVGALTRLDSIPANDEQFNNQSVALASRQSGGPGLDPAGAEVMVAWDERDNYVLAPQEGMTRVLAARFSLLGGFKDLGGGASGGGTQTAQISGNELHVELDDAPPSSPTILLAGTKVGKVTPGASLLEVDPIGAMIVFHGTSNAKGSAAIKMQLDAQQGGMTLYLQWVTLSAQQAAPGSPPTGSPSAAGFGKKPWTQLSNVVELDIY